MLVLLQEALQYIEKQNDWIIELKSTIVEKEKSYNEIHTRLLTGISAELSESEQSNLDTEQMSTVNTVPLALKQTNVDGIEVSTGGVVSTVHQNHSGNSANNETDTPSTVIQSNGLLRNYQNSTTNNTVLFVKSEPKDYSETTGQQKEFPSDDNLGSDITDIMNCSGYYSFSNSQAASSSANLQGCSTGGSFSNSQVASSSANLHSVSTGGNGQKYPRQNIIVKSEPPNNYGSAGPMDYKCFNLVKSEVGNGWPAGATNTIVQSIPNGGSLPEVKKEISFTEKPKFAKTRYNCPSCKKSYPWRNYRKFQEHLHLHTNPKPNCTFCRQEFTDLHELIHHMRINHNEEPFDCLVCKQTFTSKRKYSFHRCFTDAETPFKCDVCNKLFRCWNHYICHNQEHHRDVVGYDFSSPTKSFKFDISWKNK